MSTDPLDEALAVIDDLGAPARMSKEQWCEFLEDLIGELETRLDEVRRELEGDQEDEE